jgi:uncharacterized membrane protein YhaH (DUF805 family)
MFKFFGTVGRKAFLWGSALRIGLFIASVVGFPFFLMALGAATNCRSIGGACGAVGVVGAMSFKPLAFVVFVFSFVGIAMRRARDAGVPGWIGLFIPLLLAADQNFLVYSGTPWAFPFSAGVLHLRLPRYALLALACIAALGALPPRHDSRPSRNPFGLMGWVTFGLGIFISAYAALIALAAIPAALPLALTALKPLARTSFLLPFAMIALAALLAAIVCLGWNDKAAQASRPTTDSTADRSSFPAKTLFALSLGIAIVTFYLVDRGSTWPIGLITRATSDVLPTSLIYFFLLSTLWLAAKRKTVTACGLVALALLPFAHWGYAYWLTEQDHHRQDAEIAAIPTVPLACKPDTMVVDSSNVMPTAAAWKIGMGHLIAKGRFGPKLALYERPMPGVPWRQPRPIEALPDSYLLLKVGRPSSFAKPRQVYATAGGPFELRLIEPQRDDLIAVWYREFNPLPAFPPLLTTRGWFRWSNGVTTTEIDAAVYSFLDRALTPQRHGLGLSR